MTARARDTTRRDRGVAQAYSTSGYASGQVNPAAALAVRKAKGRSRVVSRIVYGRLVNVEARVFVRRASRRGDPGEQGPKQKQT